MSELNFNNQLDLLQTATLQRKSFRTLTLLINNIKETKEELRKAAEKVFLENPHPSTVSSITDRQSNLLSKLQIFEHEVNSLDDDGQLSQSSTRLRDDISVSSKCSSRLLKSNRSSPTRTEKSTQAIQNNNNEVKALLQPPPIPPRKKPPLFLPTNSNTQPLLSKFLMRTNQTTFSAKKGQSEPTTGYIHNYICLWHNSNWRTESQRTRRHHITSNKATNRRFVRGWYNFQQKVCWFAKNSTVNCHKHKFWHKTT